MPSKQTILNYCRMLQTCMQFHVADQLQTHRWTVKRARMLHVVCAVHENHSYKPVADYLLDLVSAWSQTRGNYAATLRCWM
jgi:predicted P-loop ATPase